MVKKAVLIIAIVTINVNGKVNHTLDAFKFSTAETPSRGIKISVVSFDIRASDQIAVTNARIFVRIFDGRL